MKAGKLKRKYKRQRKTVLSAGVRFYTNGVQKLKEGKLSEARELFLSLLEKKPDHSKAWRLLSQIACQNGDLSEGERCIQEALAVEPDFAEALVDLAVIRLKENNFSEAITSLRKAIDLKGDYALAFNVLGNAFSQQEHFSEAADQYRQAIRLEPRNHLFYFNLGNLYARHNRFAEAAEYFTKVLQINPDHIEALDNLGFVLHEQGLFAEAVEVYRRSLARNSANVLAHNNLATTYKALGRLDDAEKSCRHALLLDNNYALAHNNLGTILVDKGLKEESEKSFLRVLNLEPFNGSAWRHLVFCRKYENLENPDIQQINKALAREDLPENQAVHLLFAAGKIYDECGDYQRSFECYRQANSIMHARINYNCQELADFVDRLISTMGNDFFSRLTVAGSDSSAPVFIVGMPRSGTSLIEQIISSHPEADGVGEVHEIDRLITLLAEKTGRVYPECLEGITRETAAGLAEEYLGFLNGRIDGKPLRVTNKTPANFFHVGLIKVLFPNARIIHCVRNPLDIGISLYGQFFDDVNYAFDLIDIGETYYQQNRLMEHWKNQPAPGIYECVYEDLVGDFENKAVELINFIGLDWDSKCLDFHRSRRPVKTASAWQVRQPVYNTSVGRWKNYQQHLAPLQEYLAARTTGVQVPY